MGWLNLMADKAVLYEDEIARKDAAIAEQARKLEEALARVVEVTRERDAAVRDLREADEFCQHCLNDSIEQRGTRNCDGECDQCEKRCACYGCGHCNWIWRGVCAENGGKPDEH